MTLAKVDAGFPLNGQLERLRPYCLGDSRRRRLNLIRLL